MSAWSPAMAQDSRVEKRSALLVAEPPSLIDVDSVLDKQLD